MKLYNLGLSAIRTAVPLAVGAAVAWLGAHGAHVDSGVGTAVADAAGFAVAFGYYNAVRWAESRWSWAGWLIGAPTPPTYGQK